jgi:polar amino acid transport system ATP-binding protein
VVTSALDPELVGEVLEAVRELKAEGATMILATHEMSFAREVADEIAFLHDGRIVEQGPPAAVLSEPREAETRRFLRRLLEGGRL